MPKSTSVTKPAGEDKLQEHLDLVKELVPDASPMGAYAMGMLSVVGMEIGKYPGRELMQTAKTCSSIEQAEELVRHLRQLRKA